MHVDKDEDVLVYLCTIGERIMFGKKIQERYDNVCAPKKDAVTLSR